MKQTQIIMGMTIIVEVIDPSTPLTPIESGLRVKINSAKKVFNYFRKVDRQFSPYKRDSEVSRINRGEITREDYSVEMKEIIMLAQKTQSETEGFFNIYNNGRLDPSGIVKGWAIQKASEILRELGFKNFYVNAGGDIQVSGRNNKGKNWSVGIKNPFNTKQIVKSVVLKNASIATSGTYIRGQHIYNPHREKYPTDIVSLSVISKNIFDSDRFATAAFAMGERGIYFLESLKNVEAYMIDNKGIATETTGFRKYVI